jgi:hypothetical protein
MNLCLFGHGRLQRQVMHHSDHNVIRKPARDNARTQRVGGDTSGITIRLLATTRSLLQRRFMTFMVLQSLILIWIGSVTTSRCLEG